MFGAGRSGVVAAAASGLAAAFFTGAYPDGSSGGLKSDVPDVTT